jgi:glycosyltransferase involved in cell wall biosynthesis
MFDRQPRGGDFRRAHEMPAAGKMLSMGEANSTEPRRLRVVFVDHVARLSGGEIALVRLLPTLAEQVDVTVILGEGGPLFDRLENLGVDVEVLPLAPRLRDVRKESVRPTGLDFAALLELGPYVTALQRRIRELDPDIVHTNSLKSALYGGLAARLAGKPVVWHIRDRIASDYLPPPAVGLVRALCLVVPTAVIANSRETMTTIPNRRRRKVVYNAIVPDSVADMPDRALHDRADIVVGMVGRLTPWKGQDVFLRAFAEAFRGATVRARLVGSALFGEDAYAESLRELADALGIADQIEFRGFREDVWSELEAIDILVHCSVRPEPFGQVVLEGLAAGVPVVAADAGGPAELITDGVDGFLTTPGDAHELADVLRRLADDPALRISIGTAGQVRSLEFTPERTVRRVLRVYNEALRSRETSLSLLRRRR